VEPVDEKKKLITEAIAGVSGADPTRNTDKKIIQRI
jgi:hypothetical protein